MNIHTLLYYNLSITAMLNFYHQCIRIEINYITQQITHWIENKLEFSVKMSV